MQEVLFFSLCLTRNVCDRVCGGLCSVRVGVGQCKDFTELLLRWPKKPGEHLSRMLFKFQVKGFRVSVEALADLEQKGVIMSAYPERVLSEGEFLNMRTNAGLVESKPLAAKSSARKRPAANGSGCPLKKRPASAEAAAATVPVTAAAPVTAAGDTPPGDTAEVAAPVTAAIATAQNQHQEGSVLSSKS